MAKRISVAHAQSILPTIVGLAESGQVIELTRQGTPVAVVISHRELERLRGKRVTFAAAYRRFLSTHELSKVGVEPTTFIRWKSEADSPVAAQPA